MAVVMMGGDDEKNPIFHDFFGMNSDDNASPAPTTKRGGGDGEMEADASVGLSSEGLGANNSEVFHYHGRKNIFEPEASNTLSGRKRSISSSYMSLVRDRMLSVGSDSLENSRSMKTFGKEVVSKQLGKSHDDEPYTMQPPPRPTSILLHPPVSARSDSLVSKSERSFPMNPGSMGHCSSRFGQSGAQMEKLSLSYACKDVNVGTTLIAQAAADEGSRTGKKGSGILNIINSTSSGAGERNPTGALSYGNRAKAPQMVETESSNVPSRQMTIFYAGQAHVFDDVHPNKADVIMALAGSSGVSWSTNCSPKPGMCPPVSEAKTPSRENELRINNLPVSIPGVSDRGLIAQVAGIPLTNNLQSSTPGGHQGGRAVRDPRLITPASQPDTDGKRVV